MARNMLNIGGLSVQNDRDYRYQMPPLTISHTGRGKNVKTILENIEEIAKAMKGSSDPRYLAKYLSLESHTSTTMKNGMYYLKGIHKLSPLQNAIFKYCETFCVCPKCGDARLKLACSKGNKKSHALAWFCTACGERGLLHGNEKCFGKMKKFICNIIRTEKRSKKKEKNLQVKEVKPKPEVEDREVFDLTEWVVDADANVATSKRAMEGSPPPQAELPATPAGMLREKANFPGVKLVDIVAEFQRLVVSRNIRDDLKASRLIRDALWDDSDPDSLITSFDKNKEFLSWYCTDQTREAMMTSLIEEVIINNNWLKETSQILERAYDFRILSPGQLLRWSRAPAENSYALLDALDVKEVKRSASIFISWIGEHYEEAV